MPERSARFAALLLAASISAPLAAQDVAARGTGPDRRLHLRSATFDPLPGAPPMAPALEAPEGTRLFFVQAAARLDAESRRDIAGAGLEIVGYWPQDAYLVRGDRAAVERLTARPWVRCAGSVALAFRLDPELHALAVADAAANDAGSRSGAASEYNLVLADKGDRDRLIAELDALGAEVTKRNDRSIYLRARLRPDQLLAAAALDTVTWIDRTTALDVDMDNARIQGGANFIEAMGGLTGAGVRVEVTEGLEVAHPDWTLPPLQRFGGQDMHGHCAAMIVGGNGSGDPRARGLLPDGQVIEASFRLWFGTSRYTVMRDSVDPALPWQVMLQTASWGSSRTLAYTSASADLDNALFDHDMLLTQSHGALGATGSRPEAWAKNALSVGGVIHNDNANPADDVAGVLGPASDGRVKPELVAYADLVWTGDLTGAAGYSPGNYTNFGGLSAATPIVAGYAGLAMQMFTDGLFGNPLPLPATAGNRFANRPHAMTTKALLCNTAAAYPFTAASTVNRREAQGWGFPDVARLFTERRRMLVVDEYHPLQQGQVRDQLVWVRPGTTELRATMAYGDPAASPAAALARVNDLDLRVRRFADGVEWWGNNGLNAGNASSPGGAPNDRDTLEQVWLPSPSTGVYTVSVRATSIVMDGRPATPQLDADYALVVHPLGGGHRTPGPMQLDLRSTQPGELIVTASGAPAAGWTDGFTFFSLATAGPQAFGRFFGLEADFLTTAIFFAPAVAGDVFHFTSGGAAAYPNAPFTFAPGLILPLAGLQVDGLAVLFNGAQIVEMSNVDRVVLQ